MEKINSTCIYCVVGCRLNYVVENNAVVKVEPVEEDAVSGGYPCLRGLTVSEVISKKQGFKAFDKGK